jgi:thiamine pyrophosphokinase
MSSLAAGKSLGFYPPFFLCILKAMNAMTVILANGLFPSHPTPLEALRKAARIVCCDGAANVLIDRSEFFPVAVIGDGDSLSEPARKKFAGCLVPSACQETNDLTKAFRFCIEQGWSDIAIVGGTGKREDHTLGNLSLLADFSREASVRMITDMCIITPVAEATTLSSCEGQPVSFIACDPGVRLTVDGVRYPVQNLELLRWSTATLNVATGSSLRIQPVNGVLLVFQAYT